MYADGAASDGFVLIVIIVLVRMASSIQFVDLQSKWLQQIQLQQFGQQQLYHQDKVKALGMYCLLYLLWKALSYPVLVRI
jgi:hypothetical protein